ncbi:MAG: ribonuclease P protein component [Bacteroides sp.]|nr:ribonuclease P protein component [Bacteroides sp.]MCM1379054.1 ribonuclease P protein component [Bacteroides sp.]MCM1445752.1 ribonuclease P protein component [Prevotella sp.]
MESPTKRQKLPKKIKLCSLTAIDALFASGKGALAYPVRMISAPSATEGIHFLVSIPKKRLRHAVDRVLMRRRIREAFRRIRPELPAGLNLDIAFIYVGNRLEPYSKISVALKKLLITNC